ncbi:flagellar basal-body MS-ring/collar protein FliF [Diaminobutyricimonas sp. LJ205]|uniref:flagellar basal-body MS-ring/collar protein FliF n=1 Tax=Diaminobutyricimonas sp. LJ205 TaxID=2683590 RepID=UPI0012F4AA95|nr:flagellar basal-body MS-ring/collar protein FliF [Diaminobutyricimonas sp. LJ205]
MPQQVTSFFARLGQSIRQFTVAQRTIALIGLAVLVLGIAALTTWLAKPAYTPLFSGLNGSDANTIVEQLRADGVSYELTNGGGTILVPEESVYDQRLKAAAAGLPSSSNGGYSLLDEMGVTASEFQQSVTYKRALEGELAATISALDGVKTSSVRLAIPEETVFVSEKTAPTASVFVQTQNGVTLSSDQVQAIVHLTSASIDGMTPENVAVIDAAGTVLSAVGVGAVGGADKQATDYEQRVRGAVQAMLDQVVGPGNATVVVAADVSTESAERIEESFTTPENGPALNESSTVESYEGSGGTAAGVLGPDNIAVPNGGNGQGTFNSETSTRNNAVNKITESRVIPAGAINRQSVSVALNEAVAGDVSVRNVSDLVAAAAGIDAARGDEVTVEVVPFNTAGAEAAAEALKAAEEAATMEQIMSIVRTAIIALAIILPIVLALILYARRNRNQQREAIELGELHQTHSALDAMTLPIELEAPAETAVLEPLPTPAPTDIDRKRAEIGSLAERDPARTAEVLRGLMDDRQRA